MRSLSEYLSLLSENINQRYYFYVSFKLFKSKLETDTELKNTDGNTIYNWLMKDAGLAFYETGKNYGKKIPGDRNIWYLCLADKSGKIEYKNLSNKKDYHLTWLLKSNPDKIKKLIDLMYHDHVFNIKQHKNLVSQIEIARQLSELQYIPKYLGGY